MFFAGTAKTDFPPGNFVGIVSALKNFMNEKQISSWVRDWLVLSASVMIATWALGIPGNLATLLLVAAAISLLNSILRPVLLLISLPFLIATMGLGMIFVLWLINSFVFYVAWNVISPANVTFAAAMLGALFISGAQFCLNLLFGIPHKRISISGGNATPPPQPRPRSRHREDDNDAIDI